MPCHERAVGASEESISFSVAASASNVNKQRQPKCRSCPPDPSPWEAQPGPVLDGSRPSRNGRGNGHLFHRRSRAAPGVSPFGVAAPVAVGEPFGGVRMDMCLEDSLAKAHE